MTTTTTTRGFSVSCPKCNESGTITINAADVSELHCTSCDEEITADDVREIIKGWTKLLAWLDTAPGIDD
jgi:uncharacterized protein (DUF983 family)